MRAREYWKAVTLDRSDFLDSSTPPVTGVLKRKDGKLMNAYVAVLIVALAVPAAAYAQQVKTPSQEETLAKWPWSIALQTAPFKQESIEIKLAPKEGMEYKYRLEKDAGLLYSWTSTASLHWELHSQPDGAARGYAEWFDTNDGDRAHGIYKAPFPGIHGWWWENKSDREITITLTTAGFYNESHEFRSGMPVKIKRFE